MTSMCNVRKITHEELADLLEDTVVEQTLDIGVAQLVVGSHPTLGGIIGVSGCGDVSAVVHVS